MRPDGRRLAAAIVPGLPEAEGETGGLGPTPLSRLRSSARAARVGPGRGAAGSSCLATMAVRVSPEDESVDRARCRAVMAIAVLVV
jgi:hypothetical protein